MPYADTAQTVPGNGLATINAMVAFNITDLGAGAPPATQFLYTKGDLGGAGDIKISGFNKSGSNFNLEVLVSNSAGTTLNGDFLGLTFGTDYVIAASIDVSNASSVLLRARLNATNGSITGDVNWSAAQSMIGQWPYFGRQYSFADYYGIIGKVRAVAYQRGGIAWDATDLAAITANPAAAFAGFGWPSGTSAVPVFASQYRHRR
jgi:hypothetical protein